MMRKRMHPSWAITAEKVETAVQKIIEVRKPKKIILFGSYVNGNLNLNSDLDILVITSEDIENPRKESVRIRRALKGIMMSVDILVVSERQLSELMNIPGLIYKEAVHKGEIAYEVA